MRILFDQGTPVPIRRYLSGHTVGIAVELGWEHLKNGELLAAAEKAGYELLLTTDKNLLYQQNLEERTIAIVVIGHSQWPALEPHVQRVVDAVDAAILGSYLEVDIPYRKPGRRVPKPPRGSG
jgi:hypothetical protein